MKGGPKLRSALVNDSLSVRYPATHTGKGEKLSGSVFYWVIQKKFLECSMRIMITNYLTVTYLSNFRSLIYQYN